jgi:hypothetical protein
VKVKGLIEVLKKLPQNYPVFFPDGHEIVGAEAVVGRITPGYVGDQFRPFPNGKIDAVMFTHTTELSTGEVVNVVKR